MPNCLSSAACTAGCGTRSSGRPSTRPKEAPWAEVSAARMAIPASSRCPGNADPAVGFTWLRSSGTGAYAMPELDYMVLADYVRQEANGVIHIMGAGVDTITTAAVPTQWPLGVALRMSF